MLQNENADKRKSHYREKRHTEGCASNVTLSPSGTDVKKNNLSCGGKEIRKALENVQEYKKIGKSKFKINGHCYYFLAESMSKNKYFNCVKRDFKCHGSITITPDRKIANNVRHICNKVFKECTTTPKELPTELRLGTKINTEKVNNFILI